MTPEQINEQLIAVNDQLIVLAEQIIGWEKQVQAQGQRILALEEEVRNLRALLATAKESTTLHELSRREWEQLTGQERSDYD